MLASIPRVADHTSVERFSRQVLEAEKAVEAAAELAVPLQELMASEEKSAFGALQIPLGHLN